MKDRLTSLTHTFTFDSHLHCFKREADAVLQQLIGIHKENIRRTVTP